MNVAREKVCPLFCISREFPVKCMGEKCAFFLQGTTPTAETNVLTGERSTSRPSVSVGECAITRIARGVNYD